jgi:hypothetical protein
MKYGKAVIVGCLKNSAEFLPMVFQNLERITECFCEVSFIFIENDSQDLSKDLIRDWGEKKSKFKLFSLDGLDNYEKNRTVRLEIARNAYINAIKQDKSLHSYDYMIVMDMDDRGAYPISSDSIALAISFLKEEDDRAAVFANQPVKYYDLWALRHPQLCPFDFWHEVLTQAIQSGSDEEAFSKVYAKVPQSIPIDTPPIEVESAFGGLGIYKLQFILNNNSCYIGHEFKYFVGDEMVFTQLQTCEHVSFHRGITAKGGRMFILPFLVNSDQDTGFNPSAFRTIIINS